MAIATAAGALLALGILAMTVGLIRSESAGDLRTLTATGATSRIRRPLTATTAGALALLAALLGVAGAYVVLTATYRGARAGRHQRPRQDGKPERELHTTAQTRLPLHSPTSR